jgi:glucoamylase
MPQGARLAVALCEPAIVHWGHDGWWDVADTPTVDSGLGFHVAALPTATLPAGGRVDFTWRSPATGDWAGQDHSVRIAAAG